MSQVYYGTKVCTSGWKYYIYWPATSSTGDFRMSHKIAQWINQNEKAMKKKAKGHNMLYRECFDSYYPQILDFIASKVK